mmetsp:Transcript_19979/g.53872  ORF Transcript_19979/g.53872 Transcript_19979/m.53872 type:complete len:309 (+) Transcript_19979:98-1024(+)
MHSRLSTPCYSICVKLCAKLAPAPRHEAAQPQQRRRAPDGALGGRGERGELERAARAGAVRPPTARPDLAAAAAALLLDAPLNLREHRQEEGRARAVHAEHHQRVALGPRALRRIRNAGALEDRDGGLVRQLAHERKRHEAVVERPHRLAHAVTNGQLHSTRAEKKSAHLELVDQGLRVGGRRLARHQTEIALEPGIKPGRAQRARAVSDGREARRVECGELRLRPPQDGILHRGRGQVVGRPAACQPLADGAEDAVCVQAQTAIRAAYHLPPGGERQRGAAMGSLPWLAFSRASGSKPTLRRSALAM